MKNYNIFLLLIFTTSCTLNYQWEIPEDINTIMEAHYYMMNVKYVPESSDNWKLPENTYYSNSGDCEDQAALLANIFIYKLKYKDVKLSIGYLPNRQRHMVVKYNGDYYNAQNVYTINETFKEQYSISYDSYLFYARIR